LPAAGRGYYSGLDDAGSGGHFWSGTFGGYGGAWGLYFGSDGVCTGSGTRYYGFSVRPVSE